MPASARADSSHRRSAVESSPVADAMETDIDGSPSSSSPTYSESPTNRADEAPLAPAPPASLNHGTRHVQYIGAKAHPVRWRSSSSVSNVQPGCGRSGRVSAHDITSVSARPSGPMASTECHWQSRATSLTPSRKPPDLSSSTQATRFDR